MFDFSYNFLRFKKCKAVGMTYRDPDNILPDSDGVVPIPKELFEARQRELQETSCQKKGKLKTKMTGNSIKNSTKLELKSSLFNRLKEKENKIRESQNNITQEAETFNGISKDFGSPTFNSILLKNTIDEHILSDQESDSFPVVESIENIDALNISAVEPLEGRITCIVKNLQKDLENKSETTSEKIYNENSEEQINQQRVSEFVKDENETVFEYYKMETSYSIAERIQRIPLIPGLKFTTEESKRVDHLLELNQSIVIRFNDLEHDVAVKVNKLKKHLFIYLTKSLTRLFMKCLTKHFLSSRWIMN